MALLRDYEMSENKAEAESKSVLGSATERSTERTEAPASDPVLAAAFNTRTNAIRIHRAGCRSWEHAKRNIAFTAWTLEARTLREAYDEIERTEHATERILPVDACGCVKKVLA